MQDRPSAAATAFFLLRDTDRDVLLLERDRITHGSTGHNAGRLVSYFERPLCRIVGEFGFDLAVAAPASVDDAWDLLDAMIARTGADVLVERFIGLMGMFSLNHRQVHRCNQAVRRAGGLRLEPVTVSEEAPFLDELGPDFDCLLVVTPQDRIQALLQTGDRRYYAALCTNGSTSLSISPKVRAMSTEIAHRVSGPIGSMAAFVEPASRLVSAHSFLASPRINGGQACYDVTRRTWLEAPGPLTCSGGPDREAPSPATYSEEDPSPDEILTPMDDFIQPILDPGRTAPPGMPAALERFATRRPSRGRLPVPHAEASACPGRVAPDLLSSAVRRCCRSSRRCRSPRLCPSTATRSSG